MLGWTDADGLHIPSHFRLTSYLPQYNGSAEKQLQIQSTYDGFVATVTTTQLDSVGSSPQISKWSRVNEYRYGTISNQPATYTSPTGSLLTKDEVLKLINGNAHFAERADILTSRRRKVVLACFFCLTIIPICILLFRRFGRNA